MAQFETIMEIVKFIGKLSSKSRLIARQKVYRYDGRVKGYGPKEMYEKERRNYRYHPRRAAERAQYEKWCRACREATEIVHDEHHPRYAELHAAWEAQLGSEKPIRQFPNYLRSVLVKEVRQVT